MKEAELIEHFSDRLIDAQGPVRILEGVRWTDNVRNQYFADGGSELPVVDTDWYKNRPLGFDSENKHKEFRQLEADVAAALGRSHPAGSILLRMCQEYIDVIRLLENRGRPDFGDYSKLLFGATGESLHPGELSLAGFGKQIHRALDRIEPSMRADDADDVNDIGGVEAATILKARLAVSMECHGSHPAVVADDGITSDAAAGADQIKLREDALFSKRELRLLEVHEGWVHVGTTLNGRSQKICHFLSKGTPSSTITQEGLAVLMEIVAMASSPARQRRINNRILAVELAEQGANFLEVYRFFLEQGYTATDSYQFSTRVFRGSTPEGPPFTKDIAYTKGFVLLYNFLRAAVNSGRLHLIPLIFCGKTVLSDIGALHDLQVMGFLEPPAFVPPHFSDLHGLAAWMCYDGVLSAFGSEGLQRTFAEMLENR